VIDLTWLTFVLGLTILGLIYVRLLGGANGERHPWASNSFSARSPRCSFSSTSWPCLHGPSAS